MGQLTQYRNSTYVRLVLAFVFCSTLLSACALYPHSKKQPQIISHGYIPLDPLPVSVNAECAKKTSGDSSGFQTLVWHANGAATANQALLANLPDQTVRLAIGKFGVSGSLTYGPITTGYEGGRYQVVLDYISADVMSYPLYIKATDIKTGESVSIFNDLDLKDTTYQVSSTPPSQMTGTSKNWEKVYIPLYIGVGLRLTASVKVKKGNVNLASLGALAAKAEVNDLAGSMIVQTLGITGKPVTGALPLPSELNQTTVQNAIVSLGSIKAILYDTKNVDMTPRIVGIYNPIGGGPQLVNSIIAALVSSRPVWTPSICVYSKNLTSE